MKILFNDNDSIFEDELQKNIVDKNLLVATAFFSNSDFLIKNINNFASLKLIVRLNHGTSPEALKKIMDLKSNKIEIRFFTSEEFHPKMYIFNKEVAFIGSSNMTNKGFRINQEINISIDDHGIIDSLYEQFHKYWVQANRLTGMVLQSFNEIINDPKNKNETSFNEIFNLLGKIEYKRVIKNSNQKKHKNEDFSGYMYYCIGEKDDEVLSHRNWDDYIKYSFISAGQQKKDTGFLYSDEIRNLKKDDLFFAYKKGAGYVGYGKIIDEAVPIDEYKVDGSDNKLYDFPLQQPNIKENHDNVATEWVARVKWIKVVGRDDAKKFDNIFNGQRHTVCKISKEHQDTIDFLLKEFV